MRTLLFLFTMSALFSSHGYAQQSKRWLLGTWKSNHDLSVSTIKLKKEISPELRARLENLFGRLTVTYSDDEMSAIIPARSKEPEWRFSSRYVVVMATDAKMVLRSQNPQTKKEEDTTVTFEGPNRYWINLHGIEGREYFDRVSTPATKEPNQASEPTAASGRGSP